MLQRAPRVARRSDAPSGACCFLTGGRSQHDTGPLTLVALPETIRDDVVNEYPGLGGRGVLEGGSRRC